MTGAAILLAVLGVAWATWALHFWLALRHWERELPPEEEP